LKCVCVYLCICVYVRPDPKVKVFLTAPNQTSHAFHTWHIPSPCHPITCEGPHLPSSRSRSFADLGLWLKFFKLPKIKVFSTQTFRTWYIPSPCHLHFIRTSATFKVTVVPSFCFVKKKKVF
jgi:hypothetical protein